MQVQITFTIPGAHSSLIGGDDTNYIYTEVADILADFGAGEDTIFVKDAAETDAARYNNKLYAGEGTNTLTGGAGKDIFWHYEGDDIITDYTAGKDKVKLLGVTITSAFLDENDLVLQTTNGTITLADAKGKKITVVDAKNKTTTAEYPLFLEGLMYDTRNVILTATTDFTGETIDLTECYTTTTRVNANVVKTAIEVYGNDNNNSIKGGKGSDRTFGGTGKNIFVCEKGNDVITDYKAVQDKIKFENV